MYLQAFGEILTDALTVNPAIALIPSASAILDASNYTFQAVTLGKDSQGFNYHAHAVSSSEVVGDTEVVLYNLGKVLVQSYETGSSSYTVAETHQYLSGSYVSSLPNSPWITDTRLERGDTSHNSISGSPNLGHYINAAIDPTFSSVWNVLGSYPPGDNTGQYLFFSGESQILSGTLSSFFNANSIVDKNGFITINPSAVSTDPALEFFSSGSLMVSTTSLLPGVFSIKTVLSKGDYAAISMFGGVNHVGIYCLNMKEMLSQGLMPPYSWDALNNTRVYKLVSKITTVDDIISYSDPFGILSGLDLISAAGQPYISCRFNFI